MTNSSEQWSIVFHNFPAVKTIESHYILTYDLIVLIKLPKNI